MSDDTDVPPSRTRLTTQVLLDELGINEGNIIHAAKKVCEIERQFGDIYGWDDEHNWTGDDEPNEDIILEIEEELDGARVVDDIRAVFEERIGEIEQEADTDG